MCYHKIDVYFDKYHYVNVFILCGLVELITGTEPGIYIFVFPVQLNQVSEVTVQLNQASEDSVQLNQVSEVTVQLKQVCEVSV